MSIEDMLKGFLGLGRQYRRDSGFPPNEFNQLPPGRSEDGCDCNEHGKDIPQFEFRFHFPEAEQMFRHFEDTLNHMGLADFLPPPMIPSQAPPQDAYGGTPKTPRDDMLKEPDSFSSDLGKSSLPAPQQPATRDPPSKRHPSMFGDLFRLPHRGTIQPEDRKDNDLDSESVDFDTILSESTISSPERVPQHSSAFKSVSITTIKGADGKIEERKTIRDSSGNEETLVTRSLGDQSHTITSKTSPSGEQTHTQTYHNVDEKDADQFTDRWTSASAESPQYGSSSSNEKSPYHGDEASIFKNIFGFSFPKFRDT